MSYARLRRTRSLALVAAVALSLGACSSTTTSDKAASKPSSPASAGATGSAAALFQQLRKSGT